MPAAQTFLTLLLGALTTIAVGQNQEWSLQKCINYAIENNLDVLSISKGIEESEIDLHQSQMNRLPSVNGSASHGYYWGRNVDRFTNVFTNSSIRSNNFSLSSDVNLYNGFQTSNTIAKYKIENQLAIESLNQIKNDISLAVAAGYLNILMNIEAKQIAVNQKNNTTSQVEKIKTMVDVGQLPQGDLLDIEAQLAQDNLNITIADNNVILAYLNLTQLLQLPENEAKQFKVAQPLVGEIEQTLTLNSPDAIYQAALSQMPQIKARQLMAESVEKDLLINKGRRSPSLSLGGAIGSGYSSQALMASDEFVTKQYTLGFTSVSKEPVIAIVDEPINITKPFGDQITDNRNFNLFFQLSIPIFNKTAVTSAIGRSKIALERANINLDKEKNTLKNDVSRAHTDAQAALNKYTSAKKSEAAILASFENAQVRFNQNIISSYEFNELKNRYLRVQSEVLQAKYDFIFKSKILDFYQGKELTLN